MKKAILYTVYILCMSCVLLLLSSCGSDAPVAGMDQTIPTGPISMQPTNDTQPTQSTQPVQSDPPAPKLPQGTPLTTEELQWFNDEFFSPVWVDSDENRVFNIRNMFLAVEFSSVEEIHLGNLFREGAARQEIATQEETVAVYQKMFDDWSADKGCPVDVFKIPRQDMETTFLENTGLTIAQTTKNGLDQLHYLETYDAYYHSHSDSAYTLYQIEEGVRQENGTVALLYKNKLSSIANERVVTLKPNGDSYWFVSNLPA